jgi:hypothetical protein
MRRMRDLALGACIGDLVERRGWGSSPLADQAVAMAARPALRTVLRVRLFDGVGMAEF